MILFVGNAESSSSAVVLEMSLQYYMTFLLYRVILSL